MTIYTTPYATAVADEDGVRVTVYPPGDPFGRKFTLPMQGVIDLANVLNEVIGTAAIEVQPNPPYESSAFACTRCGAKDVAGTSDGNTLRELYSIGLEHLGECPA